MGEMVIQMFVNELGYGNGVVAHNISSIQFNGRNPKGMVVIKDCSPPLKLHEYPASINTTPSRFRTRFGVLRPSRSNTPPETLGNNGAEAFLRCSILGILDTYDDPT